MLDKIEMSLDDIIQQSRANRPRKGMNNKRPVQQKRGGLGLNRNRKVGGRIQKRGGGAGPRPALKSRFPRGDVNSAWKHDMFDGARRNRAAMGPTKLLISNLDFGVSESDIKELFSEFSTTGPLKNHSVHYDRSGRSLGTADIVFERRSDALKAMKTYNGVPLDGRPMSIQLATSDLPTPRSPRSPGVGMQNRTRRNDAPRKPRQVQQRRGGRGGGGGGPRSRMPRGKPTLEDLDAELDAYTKDMKI